MTEQNIALGEELRAYLASWGAHKVGFADLTPHRSWLELEYGEAWLDYPRAISVAVNFPRQVLDEVADGPTLTYVRYYDVVNASLDNITIYCADWLDSRGYRAFPVPASQKVGETHLRGIFTHRAAARLAGLGWIGKSCALITPDRGPRQRFCTIMTDAPLPTATPMEPRCGSCTKCVEICPVQALHGVNWQEGQPLSERLDVQACNDLLTSIRKTFGKSCCGRCLAVCPHGKAKY